MPPPATRPQVPPAWRKELTADEAIAAALAERLGLPAGAVPGPAPSAAAAAATIAVLDRPRLPGVWMDIHGSVGASMQMGRVEGRDLTIPRSPGASPGLANYLANYKEYVGLREFEAISASIDKERPSRRTCLADYGVQVAPFGALAVTTTPSAAAPAARSSSSSSSPAAAAPLAEGTKRSSPAATAPPTLTAGRLCVGLPSPRPAVQGPQGPSAGEKGQERPQPPLPRGGGGGEEEDLGSSGGGGGVLQVLEEASWTSRPQQQLQQPAANSTGRRVPLPLAPREQQHQQQPGQEPNLREGRQGQLQLRVATTQPNALNLGGLFSHRGADGGPQIRNRDRAAYLSAREMRPARERNLDSKRKLRELLELPKEKLDARGQHPSRTCGLIPAQNLRVM